MTLEDEAATAALGAALARQAAGDEDRTAPAVDHAREDMLDRAERGGEVDREDRREILVGIVLDGTEAAAGAGIGEEPVDRTMHFCCSHERVGERSIFGDIRSKSAGIGADPGHRRVQLFRAPGDQTDLGAACREEPGSGEADPGRTAGDDDMAKGAVSFRYRDGSQNNGVPIDEAVAEIVTAVRERR